jgi:hypothetical protein
MKTSARRRSFARIYRVPLLLAVGVITGLAAGLIGDGPMDVAAAICLALPVAAIMWAVARR